MDDSPKSLGKQKVLRMRDIAQAAGVHVTTVSLALRNSPQLPIATRERIKALADKMGYRPNPLVVAFVQQRRAAHPAKFQETLAFITQFRQAKTSGRFIPHRLLYDSLARRAEELGFKIDAFDLSEYNNSPETLQKVLFSRNIRGLVFPPLEEVGQLHFDWGNFATVAITSSLQHPSLDRVEFNHYDGARMALLECERRGYRKPGYVSLLKTDLRTEGRWRGGYLTYIPQTTSLRPLAPLVAEHGVFSEAFEAWWHKKQPDVLIGNRLVLLYCFRILRRLKVRIPKDLGVIDLNIRDRSRPHSGIYVDRDELCKQAVDLLSAKLYRNEFGSQGLPQTILVSPVWKEGQTLRPRKACIPDRGGEIGLPLE